MTHAALGLTQSHTRLLSLRSFRGGNNVGVQRNCKHTHTHDANLRATNTRITSCGPSCRPGRGQSHGRGRRGRHRAPP